MHCNIEKSLKTKLIFQFSSIGSLGPNENSWLCKEFFNSLNITSCEQTAKSYSIQSEQSKPICVKKETRFIFFN